MSSGSTPVGGPIVTRPYLLLAAIAGLATVLLAWRFGWGLGATTALNDGYPWGLWIAFDVVVGTALATGGYAVALLVYVLNRGRYHPLVRSALVVSALGYSLAGLAVVIDLGRFWNVWKLPVTFWQWNLNSILLEVALCIMLYTVVLWIELSPAFLERWKESRNARVRAVSAGALPRLERALPWLIALGLLLPTMHQSSLGSLMLLAGPRLHPLWNTPLLPLLFLVSCLAMGYAAVVMESTLAGVAFRRPIETPLLRGLGTAAVVAIGLYLAIRLVDLGLRGRLGLVAAGDSYALLFLAEMGLFAAAAAMLLPIRGRPGLGRLFRAAMLMVIAGGLYRFSTFLLAFDPGAGWSYFPAVPEILITLGIVAFEVMVYIALVKRFPVLAGATARPAPTPAPLLVPVPAIVGDLAPHEPR
jgi:Ni/Fe-hydrogenase subunit HybB-like protein